MPEFESNGEAEEEEKEEEEGGGEEEEEDEGGGGEVGSHRSARTRSWCGAVKRTVKVTYKRAHYGVGCISRRNTDVSCLIQN